MGNVNIPVPASLKAYVDAQAARRGYGSSGEYVSDLIRQDQERQQLRAVLLEGAASPQAGAADAAYFAGLRKSARRPRRG